jgi:hypothetical protein
VLSDRTEVELLLCSAGTRRDPAKAAQLKALLQREVDWAHLLSLAREHRMMPLLCWHLEAACWEAVPESVRDELHNHLHGTMCRNLALTGELLKLLRLFEASGIAAVPYKGPVLAALAYGNISFREFADLDFLVHKQDVWRAGELLVSAGYRPTYELTRAQEALFTRYYTEHHFTRDDYGHSVDLHWAITQRFFAFTLDPDSLWGRLERVSLGGSSVLTFSPEDLLLILCVHGAKSFWQELYLICDVAELVSSHRGMDWERVAKQAATLGSERMLFLGLYLANDLLEADLPEDIFGRVRADPAVKALVKWVCERLFLEGKAPPRIFEGAQFYPIHLKMRERLKDKIRYCARAVGTTNVEDWRFSTVREYLFPLYYALRIFRLAGKFGRRFLGAPPS